MTINLKEYVHPNGQTKVFVPTDTNDLEFATLAALYSRSVGSAQEAAEKVNKSKKSVIETYYIGYGHRSIGDMVDVKLFIENVPIFLAFLIEHHSLFRGQESSTRYIDFSKQAIPLLHEDEQEQTFFSNWYKETLSFYSAATESVRRQILEHHNIDLEDKSPENIIKVRAISARTFDICRGMLPVAALTNVAWFGTINSIRGHIAWLNLNYPFPIVTKFCDFLHSLLNEHYPEAATEDFDRPSQQWSWDSYDDSINFQGKLDFGSLRDLNRHRVGWHSIKSMRSFGDIDPWYRAKYLYFNVQIPETGLVYDQAVLGQQLRYLYAVPDYQEAYVVKLRSKYNVHPTLRREILSRSGNFLDSVVQDRLSDEEAFGQYGFYENRGKDTIVIKG